MKKFLSLLLLGVVLVAQQSMAQSQQATMVERAEIKGVESEFFKTSNDNLGIKLRNPFSYIVVAEVELHATAEWVEDDRAYSDKYEPSANQIWLKKYIVLQPREEYTLESKLSSNLTWGKDYAIYKSRGLCPMHLYVEVKAFKASVFQ